MRRVGQSMRYVAFTAMALVGLLGGMFIAGNTFADPGGWQAVGVTALWTIPMVAECLCPAASRNSGTGPRWGDGDGRRVHRRGLGIRRRSAR